MNTIGITDDPDRPRIRKLLRTGPAASAFTFGGLPAALPGRERFDEFNSSLRP